jgi:hypothetical protein
VLVAGAAPIQGAPDDPRREFTAADDGDDVGDERMVEGSFPLRERGPLGEYREGFGRSRRAIGEAVAAAILSRAGDDAVLRRLPPPPAIRTGL